MYLDFFGKLCININIFFEVILEIIKLGLKGIRVYILNLCISLKNLYLIHRFWNEFLKYLRFLKGYMKFIRNNFGDD